MGKKANVTNKSFDSGQKKLLTGHAVAMLNAFSAGVSPLEEFDPSTVLQSDGAALFGEHYVKLTQEFYAHRTDFVLLAAKMLKAKAAHEGTISDICLKASQEFVSSQAGLNDAAKSLTDLVLAEANVEYVHIEPNFLVELKKVSGFIEIGRVKAMRTQDAPQHTALGNVTKLKLLEGEYPDILLAGTTMLVGMPSMLWVVDTPSTKENVVEEAKWLIDVAVSLLRFQYTEATANFPLVGKKEAHPILPPPALANHVTINGDTLLTGGHEMRGTYVVDETLAKRLVDPVFKKMAEAIFDPPNKSLALRVAQGLGWMTRGRQVSDRAERLLAFFTALESLLSSDNKSSPIVQTISRFVSVIYTSDLGSRVVIYNHIKGLYSLRSAVVHAGRREVLWSDVNLLQRVTEAVFSVVLRRCDLTMSQEKFASSLAIASHGLPWEFAAATQSHTEAEQ